MYPALARKGIVRPLGTPGWARRGANGNPAVFDADYANNRFWHRGRVYLTEAAFNAATLGVKSGAVRTHGPLIGPSELLANGTFGTDTSGWSAFNNTALAAVAGELEATYTSANLGAFSQPLTGALGRAFLLTGIGRRGTTANTLFPVAGANQALPSGTLGTGISGTSNAAVSMLFGGLAATTYVGFRNSGSSSSGTAYFDNLSVKEAWPFQGWTPNAISFALDFTTPASIASTQAIFQADCGNERDRIRVDLRTDGHVHVIVTTGNAAQCDLDMGNLGTGADGSLAVSIATNAFSASLNGGAPVSDTSGAPAGAAILRVGASFTGEAFGGTIKRATIY